MKKSLVLLLVGFIAALVQADLVDDFEGYDIGVLTGDWEARESSTLVGFLDDGTGNQVLSYGGQGFQNAAIPPIEDTSAATTVFYRFYVANEDVDNSFGLSDMSDNGWFDGFEVQIAVIRSGTTDDGVVDFKARNSGSTNTLTQVNAGQWYNVWVVVDQTSDTYDIYLNSGMTSATAGDMVAENYGFRYGTTDPLVAIKGLGYNSSDNCLYIDDIYVTEGTDLGYPPIRPYDNAVSLESIGGAVQATLSWKPSIDGTGTYAVEPDITEEYLFLGESAESQYYVTTLGDPGTDEVTISEIVSGLEYDKTYYWTVIDALAGYEETFTTADLLDDADPNFNIVGSTWSFDSLISSAVITGQPADTRVFEGETAEFIVDFYTAVSPVVSAKWFKDDVELSAGGDISMSFSAEAGDGQAVLTIANVDIDDQDKYYCILSTDASTVDDDVQTVTRLLTIKKLLAQYSFDNAADPLENTGEMAIATPAQVKTVLKSDPNQLDAAEIAPTTTDGIVGTALTLTSDDLNGQFVDLGLDSFPKAGPLDTLGDVRGSGYEKQGFGYGMDEGSILVWVKPLSNGGILTNASNTDGTHIAVTTNGTNSARIIVRGENWDGGWQNLGEANGNYDYMSGFDMSLDGEWHMIAATWSDSTARIYINGEQVAENSQGFTEIYTPWDFSNLLGASRQGQPNRHMLNTADFVSGSFDELRIYNYEISAEAIADEYEMLNEVGVTPCMDHAFAGNEANVDNSVSSYCVVDLYDFAAIAANWLADGFAVEDVE